jgi:CDGSH-type Zn-finger protein
MVRLDYEVNIHNNKPFCDGMHKVINFKDDKN